MTDSENRAAFILLPGEVIEETSEDMDERVVRAQVKRPKRKPPGRPMKKKKARVSEEPSPWGDGLLFEDEF